MCYQGVVLVLVPLVLLVLVVVVVVLGLVLVRGKVASQAFVHPLPQVLKRMKTTIKRMEHMVDIYFMEESRRLRLSTSLGASGGSRSPVIG